MPRLLPLAAAVLGAACARLPSRAFPIGIYGVSRPAQLAPIKEAGFTAVETYSSAPADVAPLARAARRQGLRLLVAPDGLMKAGPAPRGWPLQAWYLQDEPDVAHTPPAELADKDRRVQAWDPGVPTAFVVGKGSHAAPYAATGDVLMVDWYPVPHLPLESVGEQVREVVAVARGKPVWAVLQAMDWRDYPQPNLPPKKRVGRFPTEAEIRFMSYDAVLNGASGLWYFTYAQPWGDLPEHPEVWFPVASVAREMAAMRPIWAEGKPIPPPVSGLDPHLEARAWRYHWRDYVIVANRDGRFAYPFPAALTAMSWRPLFEMRRDPREDLLMLGNSAMLRPYQVIVLESGLHIGR